MTIQEVNLHLLKTRTLLLLYVISPSSVRPSQIISIIYRAKLRSHPFPNVRSPGEKRAGLIFFGHGGDNKIVHPCLYYFFCSIFCIIKFGSNCTIFLLLLLLSALNILDGSFSFSALKIVFLRQGNKDIPRYPCHCRRSGFGKCKLIRRRGKSHPL